MTLVTLLFAFMRIGVLSFGGAYASLPLVEHEVVSAGWMDATEFADLMAMDELTPGPILINSATFVGMRVAGIPGAVAATLGCVLPSCVVSLALVLLWRRHRDSPLVAGSLAALRCMAAGLIASTLLTFSARSLVPGGRPDLMAALVVALAFACLRRHRLSPTLVVLATGCVGALLYLVSGAT